MKRAKKSIYPTQLCLTSGAGEWNPKHEAIDILTSSMEDIDRIYFAPLRRFLARTTLDVNADHSVDVATTIQILKDLSRVISGIFDDKELNCKNTHEEVYDYFNSIYGLTIFHTDAGRALCLIYYLINNIDDIARLDINERRLIVDELQDLIERTRCLLIINKYGDDYEELRVDGKIFIADKDAFISDLLLLLLRQLNMRTFHAA